MINHHFTLTIHRIGHNQKRWRRLTSVAQYLANLTGLKQAANQTYGCSRPRF